LIFRTGFRMRTRLTTLLVLSALVLPATALAETPGDDTYSDALTQQQVSDPGTTPSRGGLPFSGLELGLTVLVATGLLGAGFAIRKASRAPFDDS
jgi:hypothetical protein